MFEIFYQFPTCFLDEIICETLTSAGTFKYIVYQYQEGRTSFSDSMSNITVLNSIIEKPPYHLV